MKLPRLLNEPGPLLGYLTRLRAMNPALADEAISSVRSLMASDDGAMFLELLENSTTLFLTPVLGDQRALDARNAQALIASDLRRILSDETEQLLERKDQVASARRGRTRHGS